MIFLWWKAVLVFFWFSRKTLSLWYVIQERNMKCKEIITEFQEKIGHNVIYNVGGQEETQATSYFKDL